MNVYSSSIPLEQKLETTQMPSLLTVKQTAHLLARMPTRGWLDLKGVVLSGEANINEITPCGIVYTTSSKDRTPEMENRPTGALGQSQVLYLGCDRDTNLYMG